jgi:hypothetical protein
MRPPARKYIYHKAERQSNQDCALRGPPIINIAHHNAADCGDDFQNNPKIDTRYLHRFSL